MGVVRLRLKVIALAIIKETERTAILTRVLNLRPRRHGIALLMVVLIRVAAQASIPRLLLAKLLVREPAVILQIALGRCTRIPVLAWASRLMAEGQSAFPLIRVLVRAVSMAYVTMDTAMDFVLSWAVFSKDTAPNVQRLRNAVERVASKLPIVKHAKSMTKLPAKQLPVERLWMETALIRVHALVSVVS